MAPHYHSGSEDELDHSPQPSKRQKIAPVPSPQSRPSSSSMVRSFKQVVYGILVEPKRDSLASESTPTELATTKAPNGHASLWSDEPDELGNDEDGAAVATPTKPSSSSRRKPTGKVQVITGAGTVGNTTIATEQTPSKKRGKKFKGWEYLKEGEDVGVNNQDAFARIAEEAAREAAKASVDGVEEITASGKKSLRERNPRTPSTSLRRQEEKDVSVDTARRKTKKQTPEGKPGAKKGSRNGEEKESSGRYHELMRSDSVYDDLSFGQVVTPVRLKNTKRTQSSSEKRHAPSAPDIEKVVYPNGQSEPLDDPGGSYSSRKNDPSKRLSLKHSATHISAKPSLTAAPQPQVQTVDSEGDLPKAGTHLKSILSDYPTALTMIQNEVILQLTGKERCPVLPHLAKEYETVHQLLCRTVQAGEGNSLLLIGSRGSGKSTLVETAISDLVQSNGDDFHVVRLNGFTHTDDKLALREIWRQLGRELEGEDDETNLRSNYADTLTSLLALLSHQDESQGEAAEQSSASKSVIFVLDEFDLFAQHPRQTLLYNLFDVAQSHRNAPIAVLGLTTKVHVVDSLEKRVKSRFSQRSVHLSLPKNFQVFKEVCLEALKYHRPSVSSSNSFEARLQRSRSADQRSSSLDPTSLPLHLIEAWNAYASTLLSTSPLIESLQSHYAMSKRPADFQSAITLPLIYTLNTSSLSSPSTTTTASSSISSIPSSTLPLLLPALSTLQLSLLIAATRLDIILATDICTFDMVYEEYLALITRLRVQSSAAAGGHGQQLAVAGARGRDVARGAWGGLVEGGLIVPASGSASGVLVGGRGREREGRWRVDVSLEEIGAWLEWEGRVVAGSGAGGGGLGGVMHGLLKWCREI